MVYGCLLYRGFIAFDQFESSEVTSPVSKVTTRNGPPRRGSGCSLLHGCHGEDDLEIPCVGSKDIQSIPK